MLNFEQTSLDLVSVHRLGNRINGGELTLSPFPADLSDTETENWLKKYFLGKFQEPEFYHFTFPDGNHELNPMYRLANSVFENHADFHETGVSMARHLFACTEHPMIKEGDLFIAYLSSVILDDMKLDAIGLFKAESVENVLKVEPEQKGFLLNRLQGIPGDKPDKACLILQTGRENGYKVCIYDRAGKGEESQYWKDRFLHIAETGDDYHLTRDFLKMTKNFVTDHVDQEFEINKTDQIALLNRSIEYFKSHDSFRKDEFEEEVFGNAEVIDSFRKYESSYKEEHNIELEENFDISLHAVKKQSKIFKSVLKLDRNFHIYIHGNKNLIEHGVEKDGRKYYKIYYDRES